MYFRCDQVPVSMCVCSFGFVKEGDKCVKLEDCGCMLDNGAYVKKGFSNMAEGCSQLCICKGVNNYECMKNPCGEVAVCEEDADNGKYVCKENGEFPFITNDI